MYLPYITFTLVIQQTLLSKATYKYRPQASILFAKKKLEAVGDVDGQMNPCWRASMQSSIALHSGIDKVLETGLAPASYFTSIPSDFWRMLVEPGLSQVDIHRGSR